MIVCSIDVGIKNLAYCVFNSENYKIIKWGIIDVIDSDQLVCCATLKTFHEFLLPSLQSPYQ